MSMFTTLFTGTSGLQAHGDAISVVGDNIANVSTVGFKESRAQFADVIGGTFSNGQTIGAGVRMAGSQTMFGQGSLQATGRPLDLAINGSGFFVVKGNNNGVQGNYYSRDGRISLDKDGTLVNQEGMKLQGYSIDASGKQGASVGDLAIGGQSTPSPTTKATLGINLDATAAQPAAWDPANPSTTSNYSTSTTVYDSLGAAHRVDVYFRNQGAGNWEWHSMVDGGDIAGGTKGTPTEIATGSLGFTNTGALNTATTTTTSASFNGATPNQAIAFDFGDAIANGGTGLAGSTQFATASTVKSVVQDGYGSGSLSDVTVAEDGVITGKFSNGQTRPIGRVALAAFAAEDGLQRVGNQLYSESRSSGQPLVDGAATGKRGGIAAGSLESSNVDLASELVTLIAYQRAFSSNSKTVQTADEMLQEVANLKR